MAIKLNKKTGFYIIYGKYKTLDNTYKNYSKQTNIKSKKKATEIDINYKKELEKNQIMGSDFSFQDVLNEFLKSKKLKSSSVRVYILALKNIDFNISDLTILKAKQLSKNFNHSKMRRFKTVLNFAYKHRYINDKIADFLFYPDEKNKKTVMLFNDNLDKTKKLKIFNNSIYLNDIINFLLESGLRINEMISITFDRIHDDHIVIDRQIYNNQFTTLKSKNSERKIPITETMKSIIDRQPYVENGFLFGGVRSLCVTNIRFVLKKYYNTHPHALRHTHASRLIEYSYEVLGYCDKDNIAKHLGHTVKMLETTYKHLFRDKKHEIKQVLEYIGNLDNNN